MAAALEEEFGLLAGRLARIPTGPVIGPDCLFGSSQEAQSDGGFYRVAVDICLSGPEDTGSGPCSPGMAQLQFGPEQTGTGITSTSSAHDSEPPTSPLAFVGDDVTEETTLRAGTLSVDEFISSFKLPLPEPILLSTPKPRMTRAQKARFLEDDELVPKRSARLAAKSKHREPRPEAQARKVMMKRLGVEVETELPDEASFNEFQTAFKLPLSSSTREAMQVLFPGRKQRASRSVRAA